VSQCLPATCRADSDCGEARCGIDQVCYGLGGAVQAACQGSLTDECDGHHECREGTCRYSADDARWRCLPDGCVD
jgi:hypothetical protein